MTPLVIIAVHLSRLSLGDRFPDADDPVLGSTSFFFGYILDARFLRELCRATAARADA